ncbi:sigma-70 family RNA polymerase sigma factor [Longispora sp. NPDC051575]|uniref:RNA polymerase sigma factor n=1 Tax=Longispora sp. NPDC051575 TaxID=3154943 RepID=UPI0034454D0B
MSEQDVIQDSGQEFDKFASENFIPVTWSLVAQGATPEQAADVVQEAMVETWCKWPHSSPHAFVRLVAKRKLIDIWRKSKTERDKHGRLAALPDRQVPPADEQVVFDTEVHQLLDLIAQLPQQQRLVIILKIEDRSLEEIAELTGQKLSTVRSNLRHARNKLKQMIRARKEE